VLDVYCGTGGISIYLSNEVSKVIGVEMVEPAVRDAIRNSANNGIANCRFIAGSAEDVLSQLKDQGERFETAIADPPRPGMHPKALTALVDLEPERIIYVSCNPEALGNDLRALEIAGYRSDHVQLVDMFPHTPHCEVVARVGRCG
jgi:tRNA/tmRNA/rRNA uracil-C5-methylase (TrmA/RlmC/RlmD family)